MEWRSVPPGEALDDLDSTYSWPPDRAWLRCMMLTTLDGAAHGADGLSGSLSCPADQRVFSEVRRFAHAILIGAQTLRVEDYEPVRTDATLVDERVALGLGAAPVLVVVSSTLDLPWTARALRSSTHRPLIVTTEEASAEAEEQASPWCDVVRLPGDPWVDPIQLVSAIAYRGLTRIVCEGGPTLLSQLSRTGLIDEADITIAPTLAGGGQISTGSAAPHPLGMSLASVIEHDGWLFTRYLR